MPIPETYIHFGTSFVALRALAREIIPNTMPSQPPTHIHTQRLMLVVSMNIDYKHFPFGVLMHLLNKINKTTLIIKISLNITTYKYVAVISIQMLKLLWISQFRRLHST